MKGIGEFRRSITILLTVTVLFFTQGVYAEGGLPAFSEVAGHAMPSLGEALQRYPDAETDNEDGSITYFYTRIREDEYNAFAVYLKSQDALVANYQIDNGVLSAEIQADGASIHMIYNSNSYEIAMIYPAGTYDPRMKSAKEHLAEAEKLLQDGKGDEAYNEILAISQYETYIPANNLLQEDNQLKTVPYKTIGKTVSFGRYEQDNDSENGPEPIEWIVLDYDEKENKALLISQFGLEAEMYSSKGDEATEITWESCFLRRWLNSDFQNSAFTREEQTAILTTEVDNGPSQGINKWNTDAGNNTSDRVFLLSYSEACQYFGSFGTSPSEFNTKLLLTLTPYVTSSKNFSHRIHKTVLGKEAIVWWLRSPGHNKEFAATVFSTGLADVEVDDVACIVRPVLWLDLNADIF